MSRIKKILLSMLAVITIACVSVVQIGAEAVYIVDGYSYNILTNTTIAICGWDNRTSNLVVPDSIIGRKVVAIANTGLKDNHEITSVDFSHAYGLSSIGYQAFYNCDNISSELVITPTVDQLGISAFEGCSSLPSVDIRGNVMSIPMQCFYNCGSLTTVKLPESLTAIEKFAFADCTALEYTVIPKNVTSIAKSAFYNDENLLLGVYKNTVGHQYAVDNSIPYILLDGPKTGDANGDGMVDILDSTEIQKFAAEMIELTDEQFELADINDDGFVDVIDALLIQKYVVGKYDIPPIIYNS